MKILTAQAKFYIDCKNNPDIVFRKEDAISLIRNNKLNKIL